MKALRITYWIVTVLLAAFIVLGAVTDIMKGPDVAAFFKHLGYPDYFPAFIGTLKILGIIAILIPGYPKLREWAYAGLTFDVTGALSSHILNGDGPLVYFPALLGILLVISSYVLYNKIYHQSLRTEIQ
ncbi:MAG: DoxX family protein [Mucilaginibacter sp.]